MGEFQVVAENFTETALVLSALGRRAEASNLVAEVIEIVRPQRSSNNPAFFLTFAFAAVEVDRASEFLEVTADIDSRSPWLEAGRAYARGELEHAIELLSPLSAPDTAWVRLRAAQALVAESRRAEADEHLGRAVAFWRSVGATRYIREGEALLAATA